MQVVSDTLQLYAETSGQCINLEKSSAYFISVDTHIYATCFTSPIQPNPTSLWAQFMYYILFYSFKRDPSPCNIFWEIEEVWFRGYRSVSFGLFA